ncbi:DUF1826 domain-containing protein [Paracoccus sp. (in: a-proteobacteria)]|uniref:DUF1826 domain-containing protein n=1 Tax=Paracoccus sp. TaxID=267 RepID=UPI003A86092D
MPASDPPLPDALLTSPAIVPLPYAGGQAVTVIEGRLAGALDQIRAPGCAAAIWQRDTAPQVQSWIDALPAGKLPTLRGAIDAGDAGQVVDQACARAGLPMGAVREFLVRDTGLLASHFARIMQNRSLHLRLDVVSGNACRKFHQDYVPARLLCTYRGQGTEYGLAEGGIDGVPLQVRRMQTGWAALFRGRLWPGSEECGLVHRSPPIEGSGETRLLLVIDLAETD